MARYAIIAKDPSSRIVVLGTADTKPQAEVLRNKEPDRMCLGHGIRVLDLKDKRLWDLAS